MTFRRRKTFQTMFICVKRFNWAFPCMIFVTHLWAEQYVLMWQEKSRDLFKTVWSVYAYLKKKLALKFGCVSVCAHVWRNKFPQPAVDGRHTSSSCLPVRGRLPLNPSWLSHDLGALIKKEAKRLNSANQQVNNLFIRPWPPHPSTALHWGACSNV